MNTEPHTHQWQHRPLIEESSALLELSAHDAVHLAAQIFPCIFNYHKTPPSSERTQIPPLPPLPELIQKTSEDAVHAVMTLITAVRTSKSIYDRNTPVIIDGQSDFRAKELRILNEVVRPLLGDDFVYESTDTVAVLRNVVVPLHAYLKKAELDKFLPQRLQATRVNPDKEAEQEGRRTEGRLKIFTDFFQYTKGGQIVENLRIPFGWRIREVDNTTPEKILARFEGGISGANIVDIHEEFLEWVPKSRGIRRKQSASGAGKARHKGTLPKPSGKNKP